MSLERDAKNHFGVWPWAGRSGGGVEVRNRGGPGYYLPRLSLTSVRFPGGVLSGLAVRGECRHNALGHPSTAPGYIAVARRARLYGAVASGRVELNSVVTRTAFAVRSDVVREPFGGIPGTEHFLYYLVAQLDGVVDYVGRKG